MREDPNKPPHDPDDYQDDNNRSTPKTTSLGLSLKTGFSRMRISRASVTSGWSVISKKTTIPKNNRRRG